MATLSLEDARNLSGFLELLNLHDLRRSGASSDMNVASSMYRFTTETGLTEDQANDLIAQAFKAEDAEKSQSS